MALPTDRKTEGLHGVSFDGGGGKRDDCGEVVEAWRASCQRLKGDWKCVERRHYSRVASVFGFRPILKRDRKEIRNYAR